MEVVVSKQFPDKIIPLIKAAKSSIDIVVFDWRMYPESLGSTIFAFNQAIFQAARRGVKIRAIIHYDNIIPELLRSGIQAKKIKNDRLMHVKMMIIDSTIAIVGSHNYTKNAFERNTELSIVLTGDEGIGDLERYFYNIWA